MSIKNLKRLNVVVLLAALLAVPAMLFAQPANQTDANGKKQGPWKKYDAEGKLKYEGQFKDDKPDGKFTYYYGDGKTKMVSVYSANGTVARVKTYDELYSKVMAEGRYVNEKKDSIWTYYTLDAKQESQLISTESYDKGIKTGTWKTFYPSGKLFDSKIYKNDLLEGAWLEYFEDGTPRLKATYVKGMLQGVATYYALDGKKVAEGRFEKGMRHGVWIVQNPEGKMVNEKYNMGQLIEPKKKDTKTTPKPGGTTGGGK
ncbi:MAG: hypothetical protein M0D57_11275 [Sphingobacteriales bacterium JAD_PAG50586_3]|nr:MAG: hypothetical protein M0D57_11275 [Sphingobacteriales bacterium JAD_PAG50586_3]